MTLKLVRNVARVARSIRNSGNLYSRSPCGQQYPQVRPRLVATPPYRATLAGCSMSESCTSSASWCSTACTLKRLRTSRNCVKLSTSRRCRITATSLIRHPTAPGRTAPPTQLLWPTGFRCGWSVGLEFHAGQLAESGYWREHCFGQSLKTFLFATY